MKLPLISPRTKKTRTTVSPYVRTLSSSSHLSIALIVGILFILASSILFLPKFLSPTSKIVQPFSSSSTSTVKTTVKILVYSLYNQSCELIVQNEPMNITHAPSLANQIWFLPTSNCKIIGLGSVRAIEALNFADKSAASTYYPLAATLSLLSYQQPGSEENYALDLARYQVLFNQNLVPNQQLFDATKAVTLNLGNSLFYIQNECTATSCSVWKQAKISGNLERIYTQSNQPTLKFTPQQTGLSLTLYQENGAIITIIRLDLTDPNQIIRNTFKIGDKSLEQFGL